MTTKEKDVLIAGLKKLSDDVIEIASLLEKSESPAQAQDAAAESITSDMEYTYETVRGILAEKSRTGFRAEVKALLTKHGVNQLSEVKDPKKFAAIVAEAEEIGNG